MPSPVPCLLTQPILIMALTPTPLTIPNLIPDPILTPNPELNPQIDPSRVQWAKKATKGGFRILPKKRPFIYTRYVKNSRLKEKDGGWERGKETKKEEYKGQ